MEYALINNFNDIKELKLEPNIQYLCLMECYDGVKMVWKAIIAYFFKKGDELTLYDKENIPHKFDISETGFYYVHQIHDEKIANRVVKLNEVRYYAKIEYPNTDPDSFMQIEN